MTGVPQLMKNPLIRDTERGYGGTASDIYDRGCALFGWYGDKRSKFKPKTILYATNATKENYSVWFLTHNSWTNTHTGGWYNKILRNEVKEYWLKRLDGIIATSLFNDNTTRVTFAKNENGEYVFIGIFKPFAVEQTVYNGKVVYVKRYKLISRTYPTK